MPKINQTYVKPVRKTVNGIKNDIYTIWTYYEKEIIFIEDNNSKKIKVLSNDSVLSGSGAYIEEGIDNEYVKLAIGTYSILNNEYYIDVTETGFINNVYDNNLNILDEYSQVNIANNNEKIIEYLCDIHKMFVYKGDIVIPYEDLELRQLEF